LVIHFKHLAVFGAPYMLRYSVSCRIP